MLFGTNMGFSGTPSSLLPNEIGGVDAHVLTTAPAFSGMPSSLLRCAFAVPDPSYLIASTVNPQYGKTSEITLERQQRARDR